MERQQDTRARILSASAGSGKTYRLAYKYILDTLRYFEEKPYLYRAVLAVTFTNKATEEMKSRILNRYAELATDPSKSEYVGDLRRDLPLSDEEYARRAKSILKRILHDYSHFTVLTIDKFFQRIMRAFVKEMGVDVNYNLQIKSDEIVSQSADALIESIRGDEELQQWIVEYARENIENDKSWSQIREDILSAGEQAIGDKSHDALQSRTTKQQLKDVADAAKERLNKKIDEIAELGDTALTIIKEAGASVENLYYGVKGAYSIFVNAQKKNIEKIKTSNAYALQNLSGEKDLVKTKRLLHIQPGLLDILRKIFFTHNEYTRLKAMNDILWDKFRSFALLKDIYAKIQEVCQTENMMLLSETKNLLTELIKDNDTPFIYEKTGNHFERYMIDEFQDTSHREWNNFIPLLLNAMAMAEDEAIFIVGDVKQAIYRWRGGDWRILHSGVQEALGKANTHTEPLKANWRSREAVVRFNNKYIPTIVKTLNTHLNNTLDEALQKKNLSQELHDELYDTLRRAYADCDQEPKKVGGKEGYVGVELYETQSPIIAQIEDVISRGYNYNDIMILHRTGNEITRTAECLLEYKRQSGKEFNIKTKESLVVGRADIAKFIIALLRLTQDSSDRLSIAIVNQYLRRSYHDRLSEEELTRLSHLSQLSVEQAFEHIVKAYSLHERGDEIAYLQALHNIVIAFSTAKSADIALFLKEWDATLHSNSLVVEDNKNTIELTTIHTAKGLERKIIIIPYCHWQFIKTRNIPTIWTHLDIAKNPEEYAMLDYFPVLFKPEIIGTIFSDDYYRELVYTYVDSANLLYVALTRAVDELYVNIKQNAIQTHKNMGAVIWDALKAEKDTTIPNSPEPREEDATIYEYGSKSLKELKVKKDDGPKVENIILDNYPTTNEMVAMRLPLQRYFEQSEDEHSPRRIGILMHNILSSAQSLSDVEEAIDDAHRAGRIDAVQRDELRAIVEKELRRNEAQEWFNGDWEHVYNECDIIHDKGSVVGQSRPDRVMVKGQRAVIVDYKFGAEKLKIYRQKMEYYKELISRMGYTDVEGYLWYLTRSEIEKV
ncbi:MAG: UvrD-helicase domain-containing protein [Alistipes sp.]|nr:UvrD-helicase domain-containing protein [Alistipes sp.]